MIHFDSISSIVSTAVFRKLALLFYKKPYGQLMP